jgi:uncharacterized protein (UPF0303 family)
MDIAKDLTRIALQEQQLQFDRFDAAVAWEIGSWLRNAAAAQNQSVAIDITLAGAPLFYHAMPGATPNNAEWIRRKKNVLNRFHKSTYAVGLDYQRNSTTLEARTGAPLIDFVTAGGCFPIRIKGSAAVARQHHRLRPARAARPRAGRARDRGAPRAQPRRARPRPGVSERRSVFNPRR